MENLDLFRKYLIGQLRLKNTFKIEVVEEDSQRRKIDPKTLVERLREDISKDAENSPFRVIFLDLEDYANWLDFYNAFVSKTFDEINLPQEDTCYTKDVIVNNPVYIIKKTWFEDVLKRVDACGWRLLFVVTHYELAPNYGESFDFGHMRALFDKTGPSLSAVFYTSKSMIDVSKKPSGSPFYNIFVFEGSIGYDEQETEDFRTVENDEAPKEIVATENTVAIKDVATTENIVATKNAALGGFGASSEYKDFIGRKKQLKRLHVYASTKRRPRHLSIYGLPQVGKTWLVGKWFEEINNNQNNNQGKTRFGKDLYVPFHSALDVVNYKEFASKVLMTIENDVRDGKIKSNNNAVSQKFSDIFVEFNKNPLFGGAKHATELLSSAFEQINNCGLRVTLILDEFDHVDEWEEEDYRQFCLLLLDERLDLFCVTVSRPPISYIIHAHDYQIIPFKSCLLKSFSDEEMKDYFDDLDANHAPVADIYREDFLYAFGTNPKLLHLAADKIKQGQPVSTTITNLRHAGNANATPGRPVGEVLRHYFDVVDFMYKEEMKKDLNLKSLAHVVKCYMGASADYADIIDTYVKLGYIEELPSDASFAKKFFNRYARFNENGKRVYYMTVSPGFIDYLYTGVVEDEVDDGNGNKVKTYIDILNRVHDLRDLYTSLIHTIRYITEKELEDELKNYQALYGDRSSLPGWFKQLVYRFRANMRIHSANIPVGYNLSNEYPHYLFPNYNYAWSFLPADRIPWVHRRNHIASLENNNEIIEISRDSMRIISRRLGQQGNQPADILDAISLVDHANILYNFPQRFAKYFNVFGDMSVGAPGNDPQVAKDLMKSCLKTLHEAVRNPISHYSRRGITGQEAESCRQLCIILLKSVNGYITNKSKATPIPNVIQGHINTIKRNLDLP